MHTQNKVKRFHGGVCILLKDKINESYNVSVVDKPYNGILTITLWCETFH